jgi:hypothetical protein
VDADVAHADEQVLAVAEYLVDDVTRQIDGGELRDRTSHRVSVLSARASRSLAAVR